MIRLSNLRTGWLMTFLELVRNRIAMLLLFLVPTLFYAIIVVTTSSETQVAIQLASLATDELLEVSQRHKSLVFIGLTSVGLLAAFLALNLMQKGAATHRRLVMCGFRPSELITSKLAVLVCVVLIIAAYVAAMIPAFFVPHRFLLVIVGFTLVGYVYACYGLLVGSIFKRELEGILCIILLANLDAGWLQNPIYYATAQNKAVIRLLPAYFPSQVSMVSAFTDHSVDGQVVGALVYGTVLLLAASLIFWIRVRPNR